MADLFLFPCSSKATKKYFKVETTPLASDFIDDLEKANFDPSRFSGLAKQIKDLLVTKEQWMYAYMPIVVKEHPCFASVKFEPIGSSMEGLSLAEYSEDSQSQEMDFTAIVQTITVSHNSCTLNGKEEIAEIQYSKEFPGHAYLKLQHQPGIQSDWTDFCNIVSRSDCGPHEFYLCPAVFTDEYFLMTLYRQSVENLNTVTLNISTTDDNGTGNVIDNAKVDDSTSLMDKSLENHHYTLITQQGPAITTTFISRRPAKSMFQFDCAVALPCKEWPTAADEWKVRFRSSGWPTQELIEEVTSAGCLFVPKSPENSQTNLEWRLSFCLLERQLLQCINEWQRKCYVMVKAIWRRFVKPPVGKAVQSYHLKNIFLWECEFVPQSQWTECNMVLRVIGLLQRLHKFLVYGNCPHYVIPANNLFQDIEGHILVRTAQRVQTTIFRADVVWIDNPTILLTPPHQTRTGMKRDMYELYVKTVDILITRFQEIMDIEERTNTIPDLMDSRFCGTLLAYLKGIEERDMIVTYLKKAFNVSEMTPIRNYICSRATPKELEKMARDGGLDGIGLIVNVMLAWGEMIELVTKLDILQSDDLAAYGITKHYVICEKMKLLLQCGIALQDDNSDDESVDEYLQSYECDMCGSEIEGSRFHCRSCEDFDLCPECYKNNIEHNHEFHEICVSDTDSCGSIDNCKTS